jgi:hypothetical protein
LVQTATAISSVVRSATTPPIVSQSRVQRSGS